MFSIGAVSEITMITMELFIFMVKGIASIYYWDCCVERCF